MGKTNISKERWTSLLDYYIGCLERETVHALTFFQNGLNEKYFAPFENESILSTKEGSAIINNPSQQLKDFVGRLSASSGKFYYGFPLFRQQKISAAGNKYIQVSPVLYSEVRVIVGPNTMTVEVLDSSPNINETVFKEAGLSFVDIDAFVGAMNEQLIEEDSKGDLAHGVKSILDRLTEITQIPSYTTPDLNKLDGSWPPKAEEGSYLLNSAILFHSESQQYHASLLRELEELKMETHFDRIGETALGALLSGNSDENGGGPPGIEILLVSEINKSQVSVVSQFESVSLTKSTISHNFVVIPVACAGVTRKVL